MEDPWAYRSKIEFTFGQEGDRITLGFHERGSFQRIVDIVHCHIAPPPVSDLLQVIKESVNRFPQKAYNPKIHRGFWRYAVVRSSLHSGALMLLLVTNEGPREPIDALAASLPSVIPELKSFYWGVSTKVSDVAQPEHMTLIFGSPTLEDQIGGTLFQIQPMNFVQPNLILAAHIYEAIQDQAALTGQEAVYDLYCGIGLIALSLARRAKAVYGVESDPENVAFAERNARLNGINNAVFLCGRVEDLLKGRALFKVGPKPDLIIADPPRVGLHKEVYAPLLEAAVPTLMYLSCNPVSLAKDLKILLERDRRYQAASVQIFDFFPHTAHMEVLVILRRQ
jgi:23S rRNA (uracil1939-C5)-methyltransferase